MMQLESLLKINIQMKRVISILKIKQDIFPFNQTSESHIAFVFKIILQKCFTVILIIIIKKLS